MRRIVRAAAFIVAFAIGGCAASFNEAALFARGERAIAVANARGTDVVPPPPPSARCVDLDDARRTWGGVAKAAAGLSGAQGLATIPVSDYTGRVVLASGAVVVAVVAGIAVYVSEDYGATWARECSAP